jgi:flagellar biosynthesis GTPase FlhF
MPEELPQQSASEVITDVAMRRLREYVSALIALLIILSTLVMMIQAFNHLGTPDEFARVKDLLLFINPLLGVVIGYYFNKVTSEARAETAETTAKSAMANAQQASEARNAAEAEAKEAKSEAKEVKTALKEVGQATEKMLAQMPAPAVGVLSAEEGGEQVEDARLELKMAWNRAKRLVE